LKTSYKAQLKLRPKRQEGTNYRKITVKKIPERDKKIKSQASLLVQWLRIHLPMPGDMGSIPDPRGSHTTRSNKVWHHNY